MPNVNGEGLEGFESALRVLHDHATSANRGPQATRDFIPERGGTDEKEPVFYRALS